MHTQPPQPYVPSTATTLPLQPPSSTNALTTQHLSISVKLRSLLPKKFYRRNESDSCSFGVACGVAFGVGFGGAGTNHGLRGLQAWGWHGEGLRGWGFPR